MKVKDLVLAIILAYETGYDQAVQDNEMAMLDEIMFTVESDEDYDCPE